MSETLVAVDGKVYDCTGPDGVRRKLSMTDLLGQFRRPEFMDGGVSRISDLHLKCGSPPYFRVDSDMVPWSECDEDRLTEDVIRDLIGGMLSPALAGRLDENREIDAGFTADGQSFRINVFRDNNGLAVAIRVLPAAIPPVEGIGFPEDFVWQDIIDLRQGLVVLTGITGSGKSTTIASLIDAINKTRRCHIITLEDPVEYVFRNRLSVISQRQVGRDTSSFSEGLRAILREDPDIIFVGEIRDQETLANALTAAETGHLVFSTLHTRDAKGVVMRMADLFPGDRRDEVAAQIALSLSWVIAQKLLPRADGAGRMVAMEVMRNNHTVASLIRQMNVPQIYSAIQTSSADHMVTLEQRLAQLVRSGSVAHDEALRSANIPETFEATMAAGGA